MHPVGDTAMVEEGLAATEPAPDRTAQNLFTLFRFKVGEKADLHQAESVFAPKQPQ
jgi:hypothetical protein